MRLAGISLPWYTSLEQGRDILHRINKEFEVFIPNGRAINPVTKDNWEGVGVRPNFEVPHDKAFGVIKLKGMIAEELAKRQLLICLLK
ncbi:MAG: peptidase [Paenibacillus sp.]|nr:peptidase [Paenibacillus sp.]